jgi:general secretion pathway protein G
MNITAHKKTIFSTGLGFTLIELLVVVSIIGILATLVTANLNAARSRSRDAVRKADMKNLQTALRLYYNDSGSYPSSVPWGLEWSTSTATYMKSVPDDPLPDQTYSYVLDAANDSFTLSTCLENKSDALCKSVTVSGWTCQSGCVHQVVP